MKYFPTHLVKFFVNNYYTKQYLLLFLRQNYVDRMKIYRFLTVVLFLFLKPCASPAQEMLGTTLGNYAGVNSMQLNPSALHNSKSYLDVQLTGLDLFFQNNALYISKSDYRFTNFFKAGYEWPMHIEYDSVELRPFYRYDNARNKNVFVNTRLNGPGAMLIWGNHAFALTTSFRSVASLHNIPYDLANFAYLGLNYRPQQNINYTDNKPFTVSAMAWGEIGLGYAYTFTSRGFNRWSAGISVKRLLGVGGMYLASSQLDYIVPNDTSVMFNNLDAEIGMALPLSYNVNEVNLEPLFKGGGFGFDIGVTYQRLARWQQNDYYSALCAQPYEDYIYRIGVALIDIGGIRFNNNAVKMKIDNRSTYWEGITKINFRNINQLLDTISYQFYGDTTSAYQAEKFMLWLPSALSVQFDYHLQKYWYVNASLIYGFPLAKGSLARPAELSITPRYETSIFEVSMPVALYDWSQVRAGLAVRVYGVTIGTEKLSGFFNFSDFSGLDFYCSIKLFFNKGNCKNKGPVHCGTMESKPIRY